MFIFNFVVQFLYKRYFRSKIGDIAPLTDYWKPIYRPQKIENFEKQTRIQ